MERKGFMRDRVTHVLVRHCRWLTIVCLCSVALPAYWLRDARVDNSIEVWIGARSEEYRTYRRFLDKYGNEEFIVVAAEAEDPLSEAALGLQEELAERLRQIDGVDGVLDVSKAASLFARRAEDWKDLLHNNVLFRNLLLGEDGRTFGLIVWLSRMASPAQRKLVVETIESAVAETTLGRQTVHLAGTPLLNVALDRGSQNASRRFLPVALVVSVVILVAMLRRVSGVVAVICAVGVSTVWTIGLMVLAGKTFNMVTVTLPSLLVVLSLSGGIHITARFQSLLAGAGERKTALEAALGETLPPVLLSNVTTATGFGSLMISDMRPVVDFGQFAAVGMLASFAFNAMVVPGVLSWLHAERITVSPMRPHWTIAIGRGVVARRVGVLAGALAVAAVSVLLMKQIRVESNVLKFFPEDSPVSQDYRFVADRLTGLYTIELDASAESSQGSTLLKEIERLGTQLLARPEVAQVIHYRNIATCLDAVPRPAFASTAPDSENPLRPMQRRYLHTEDGQLSSRLSILVRAMASTDFYTLTDFADTQAGQIIRPPATYTLTGVVPLLNAAQRSLVTTQVRSFAIAASVVLVLIGLFLWSIRAVAAALLPNLLPIFCLFTAMVLLGIPLDAATVMIAGVAIGIAADDTIHFLSCFRRERQSGADSAGAIARTFEKAGAAITFTSVVAAAGFVILLLAEFKPIQYFGLLAGLTMITAWIGDVFVLPACVTTVRLWDREERKV